MVWFSLQMFLLEYCPMELIVARSIGELLGEDLSNSFKWDPNLCVTLDMEVGWVAKV